MSEINIHAIRALNVCRQRHKPTYVALRSLLDFEHDANSQHVVDAATHKLLAKKEWRYFSYPVLKDVNGGNPIYRPFMTGSPFTLLAESVLLSMLAQENAFKKTDYVYSYLWPKSNQSGHNYRFYRYGYLSRNRSVQNALKKEPGCVAVVNDIRSFYPSIEWSTLLPRIQNRFERIESQQTRRIAEHFIASFQHACKQGLAIGPDISHLLADIAMEDVDAVMSAKWPNRYFRYVDDIIVVCKPTDVDTVQKQLEDLLAPLKLHEGKRDIVSQRTWDEHCPEIRKENSLSTFGGLMRAIELVLLHTPQKAASLETRFREYGFSMPFRRLTVGTQYGRLKSYLNWILSANIRAISRLRVADLVESAKSIRSDLEKQLIGLADGGETAKTRRRWFVQNVRYRINRLVYLTAPRDYERLLKLIPSGPEFDEQRLVLNAIANNDPLSLLPYPGATLSTYCELMVEHDAPAMPTVWPTMIDRPSSESATMFALYFGWAIPANARSQMFTGSRMLLERFTDDEDKIDGITEQSYLDEMDLLLSGTDSAKRLEYARTRVSSKEIKGLEAFGLGDNYS